MVSLGLIVFIVLAILCCILLGYALLAWFDGVPVLPSTTTSTATATATSTAATSTEQTDTVWATATDTYTDTHIMTVGTSTHTATDTNTELQTATEFMPMTATRTETESGTQTDTYTTLDFESTMYKATETETTTFTETDTYSYQSTSTDTNTEIGTATQTSIHSDEHIWKLLKQFHLATTTPAMKSNSIVVKALPAKLKKATKYGGRQVQKGQLRQKDLTEDVQQIMVDTIRMVQDTTTRTSDERRGQLRTLLSQIKKTSVDSLEKLAQWFRTQFQRAITTTLVTPSSSSTTEKKKQGFMTKWLNRNKTPSTAPHVLLTTPQKTTTTTIPKYAIVIGIGYFGSDHELGEVCIRDMQAHLSLLETHYGYSKSHIMILTDDPQRSARYHGYWSVDTPTHSHVETAMKRYISQLQVDAKAFPVVESMLVYSGHGSSQLSTRWDEVDSQMECLLCTDGPFWDLDFFNQFESQLPSQVRHLSFFDSCMSGTMSNLPWIFNILSKSFNQSAVDDRVKAECHAISGCTDCQVSAAEWKNGCSALTGAYLECLEAHKYQSLPLAELMVEMRLKLRERQNYQVPMWTSNRTDLTTCVV